MILHNIKLYQWKKKPCVPSPKSYLVSSDIEVEQNMSWIPLSPGTQCVWNDALWAKGVH